jgi:hypothetical protein
MVQVVSRFVAPTLTSLSAIATGPRNLTRSGKTLIEKWQAGDRVISRTGARCTKQVEVTVVRLAVEHWLRAEAVTTAGFFGPSLEKDAVIHAGGLEPVCPALVSV